MARVIIVTDTWHPQVNGAVTTLDNTVKQLQAHRHAVTIIDPSQFPNRPCPTYPEIRLARTTGSAMARMLVDSRPDHVHIAIEGPLGLTARRVLINAGGAFTTTFFTNFHDYLWHRFAVPKSLTLAWMDWFHRPSSRVLTPTPTMQRFLAGRGYRHATTWPTGVDFAQFVRGEGPASRLLDGLPRPINLYIGRIAVEKNIEAFLSLDVPGAKVLVGDGPQRNRLQRQYPAAIFLGYRTPTEIAQICTVSDVMVFPSRTDTFGHVIVEALACGLPVAAFPVTGPRDILTVPGIGAMATDLAEAVAAARRCAPETCMTYARAHYRWERSMAVFVDALVPVGGAEVLSRLAASAGRA